MPMVYLVDSAGARITDQVQMFPGRRGAGRIFYNEVRLSGRVPQVCVLFGPSAAGGAYIPAFCDVVIMREGNASMYLGSPRMAEMVIGEKVTLEEMGGAKMHTSVSGCGHFLVASDEEGIDLARRYLSYFPSNWTEQPPPGAAGRRRRAERDRRHRARGPEQAVRHARADRRADRRGLVARGAGALGARAGRRLRAPRRPRRRHRGEPAEGEGRRGGRNIQKSGETNVMTTSPSKHSPAVGPRRGRGPEACPSPPRSRRWSCWAPGVATVSPTTGVSVS